MPQTANWPAHWDAQRIAEFKRAQSRVTHREQGTIPLGMATEFDGPAQIEGPHRAPAKPTCRPLDMSVIWTRVARYRRFVFEYVEQMNRVREGLINEAQPLLLAA